MKALSLWQPWASLIAIGAKRVETRSWPAPASVVGQRIAIHAAKTTAHIAIIGEVEPMHRRLREARDAGTLMRVDGGLPLGAIVATARLSAVTLMTGDAIRQLEDRNPDEHAFGLYEPGRWAWVLKDVEALAEPVAFRGMQGLFDVPAALIGATEPAPVQGALL